MTFRKAAEVDVEKIATLHSVSWQQNYRDSFSDHFLDNLAFENRLIEWKKRFEHPSDNQFVFIAEEDGEFLGFMCAYFNHDVQYGTLLDNLHVSLNTQGKGIGTRLIAALAEEIVQRNGENGFYLWVLNTNIAAIKYYEKIGGVAIETVESNDIGDKTFLKIRYYWQNASEFLENVRVKRS
ncbi:GNAT family N-acetyltransferase [Maribacter stanieri]|uniref:Ribosomal protein S18 acetylase RimI n=1 Tax=Maribacter stanieri TaxID=440514 RepID=A0A1I6I7U9_9FLAO|nr:GNAT family N-acetyltransferase [Maribacter stanieri]SFR62708.1 Ribosomal protein S18 acetylase RimI [Maribacter stanieri]